MSQQKISKDSHKAARHTVTDTKTKRRKDTQFSYLHMFYLVIYAY